MTNPSARRIVLASRPKGKITESDFRLERTEAPRFKAGWRPAQCRTLVGKRPPHVCSAFAERENASDHFIEGGRVGRSIR